MGWIIPPPRGEIEPRQPPTFSIVIPAYQAAGTVGDAVRSAVAQTRPAHEVIVVDDGSTDDLAGALEEFDGQIRFIRKENGGAASARNAGVRVATGDFVAFLDADDAYHPCRIEALGELAAARPDLDILTTDTEFIVGGRPAGRFHADHPFPVEDQRSAILKSCFTFGCPAVSRSRLLEIGGFDETLRTGEDWDCMIRLILGGAAAGLVDAPYLEYRLRPDSLTASRLEALWDRVRLLDKAGRSPALRSEERPALARSLLYHRTRAALAEAEVALAHGKRRRARFLRLAASRRVTKRGRVLLVAAALTPGLAQRWMPRDPGSPQHRMSGLVP
jgi:hypothetical protein